MLADATAREATAIAAACPGGGATAMGTAVGAAVVVAAFSFSVRPSRGHKQRMARPTRRVLLEGL